MTKQGGFMSSLQRTVSKIAGVLTLGVSNGAAGRIALRRLGNQIVQIALGIRSGHLNVDDLGAVLVIAPHPDDEAIGCGGTIALLSARGAPIHLAFLTNGEASHPNHPLILPTELSVRRRTEARTAAGFLGVELNNIVFFGLKDGSLADLYGGPTSEAVEALAKYFERLAPAVILLPCRHDGSSEHDAAFALVSQAIGRTQIHPRLLEFPVWSWWSPALLIAPLLTRRAVWRVEVGDVLSRKIKAMESYTSQILPIPPEMRAALPAGFMSMYTGRNEFLFES